MRALILLIMMTVMFVGAISGYAEMKPLDETVVAIAKSQGADMIETPLNAIEGDLLLFLFLIGGSVGGFIAGYYYRILTEKGEGNGASV